MRGAIPPLPQYDFMVWCLVKHSDIFTFILALRQWLLTIVTRYVIGRRMDAVKIRPCLNLFSVWSTEGYRHGDYAKLAE